MPPARLIIASSFNCGLRRPPIKPKPCKGDPAAASTLVNSPLAEQIAGKQNQANRMVTLRQYDYLNRLTSIVNAGRLRMAGQWVARWPTGSYALNLLAARACPLEKRRSAKNENRLLYVSKPRTDPFTKYRVGGYGAD